MLGLRSGIAQLDIQSLLSLVLHPEDVSQQIRSNTCSLVITLAHMFVFVSGILKNVVSLLEACCA